MQTELNKALEVLENKRVMLEALITAPGQRNEVMARLTLDGKDNITLVEVQQLLVIVEEMIQHFSVNYLDDKGELIKFSIWQMLFDAKYRKKIFDTVLFVKDVIIKVVTVFKK